ncbi:MAG: M1 family metallopeptidase [Bacteroidia bacterium]
MRRFPVFFTLAVLIIGIQTGIAQDFPNTNVNKFKQLKEELPTPTIYRAASGAPGHAYWQNRADYAMDIRLDEKNRRMYGSEIITYHNASPDALRYLWLQLDQNMRALDSESKLVEHGEMEKKTSIDNLVRTAEDRDFDGGFRIDFVKDAKGNPLPYFINKTMMRVDLPEALKPGGSVELSITWWYNINDRKKIGGRSGYEYFPEQDNYLFTIAQFFPRMCVYNETEGWQNKQFLGRGEFTLPFGNYKVNITVPADHIVAATGLWQNPASVLTAEQRKRLDMARKSYDDPVMIVTAEEALVAEGQKAEGTKTWSYAAENVRDFAFASSRQFIWDAMAVKIGGKNVLAMSYYPKEGNPLWEKYSTRVVAHTLRVYSKYTIDYPYPVAISVHTDRIGMEYPMICFNGGRPEPDGTYTARTKHGMISVIIHEVGHNFFPMIINSDERQWTWMDEGLNTFVQYLTEQEWDREYPSRRGPAYKIVDYMKGDKRYISPIMTNSESIWQFGNNAYGKPATALNILRETVMGRELFDYSFKEYCRRWAFRHPNPEDFFRSMEDASGVDLDWFWRGWFYTTDHVDLAIDEVKWFQVNTKNPEVEKSIARAMESGKPQFIGDIRNQSDIPQSVMDARPDLQDFYNKYDEYAVDVDDKNAYQRYRDSLTASEARVLDSMAGKHFYELGFVNKGGLVMPVILQFTYEDSSQEVIRIPAEIWRKRADSVSKIFITDQPLISVELDPFLETADTDTGNNVWPPRPQPSRFELFLEKKKKENPMQRATRLGVKVD